MSIFKVSKNNFNFNKFVKTIADFIADNFGSDSPAETMRYFYSFNKSINENDDFELNEIQNKIATLKNKFNNGDISKKKFELRHKELLQRECLRKEQIDQEQSWIRKKMPIAPKDPEIWDMKDFKDAILKNNETIFFPFSSGLDEGGYITIASGRRVLIGNADEMEGEGEDDADESEDDIFGPLYFDKNPGISMTDCFGILVKKVGKNLILVPAIAWGDMASSIEPTDAGIYNRMNTFIKTFLKSYEKIIV